MTALSLISRLLGGTRGRIVALLRRSDRTVNDLAAELALTDNAVRPHLATLERDGLVSQEPVRGGVGKPAARYSLTPTAETLLSRAYPPVLVLLLDELSRRLPREEVEAILREIGRRAGKASAKEGPAGTPEAAVAALERMGGEAVVERLDGQTAIRGYGCPLGAVVNEHPEVCRLAEALVAEVAGVPAREHCNREGRPRCCFLLGSEL